MGDPLHGYTVRDIEGIARGAAAANRWAVSDFSDRYETAWDAVVTALLTAGQRPEPRDLGAVAKGALMAMVKKHCDSYGYSGRDLTAGIGSAPRFAAYWHAPALPMDEAVVERVAAGQVWAALTDAQRDTIAVLGTVGADGQRAAALLGISAGAWRARVIAARRAFAARWYGFEGVPAAARHPGRRPHMRQAIAEAPCGTIGAYRRHKRRGEPVDGGCAAAAREYERARKQRRAAA